MKNRDVNKDVLKAISIGLAATLALMPNATAFAAEGETEPESESNDTHEESSHEESHESSATESVSEASESVSEAASEMAQSEAPAASEAAAAFSEAAETLGDIASGMAESDMAAEIADEKTEYFGDMQHVADISSGYAAEVTSEAAQSVQAASDTVQTALDDANTKKDEVTEAAAVTYTSQAAADSAQAEADEKLEEAKAGLTESQAAVEEAESKLYAASMALTTAEEAVDHAAQAKAAADKAVEDAKAKLKAVLDENGVVYSESDGEIVVDESAELTDGRLKRAVEAAQSAVDRASADAEAAAEELETAKGEEYLAALNAARLAGDVVETARLSLNEVLSASQIDEETAGKLDELIQMIKDQQAVVSATTEIGNDNTAGTMTYESKKLAAYMEAFKLAQKADVVSTSVSIDYDATNSKWFVRYKTQDNLNCFTRHYVNAWAYNANGKNKWDVDNKGYIESMQAYYELKPYSFAGNEAQELVTLKAGHEIESAGDASGGLAGTVSEINALLSSKKEMGWKDRVALTEKYGMVFLSEHFGYDISSLSIETRDKNTGYDKIGAFSTEDKSGVWLYITIGHTDKDGNMQKYYFTYSDDGSKDSTKISLVNASEMGAANPGSGPRETYSELDFNAGNDDYSRYKAEIDAAQEAYDKAVADKEAADAVLSEKEDLIKDLEKQKAAADALKEKVDAAKEKVDEAARALKDARTTQAMDADRLSELTERLEAARAEYDEAVEALDAVKEKTETIRSVIDEIEETIGGGFSYVALAAGTGSSGTGSSDTSGGSSGESGGASSVTASVAATTADGGSAAVAASGGTSAEATGAEVLGERQAPTGGGAGMESAAPSESEVLGERQAPVAGDDLLEEGVLGERQAPIIQAYEDGTFSRKMMFTEDGVKVSFLWWLIILMLGAKGVQMYAKSRKNETAEDDRNDR